MAAVRGRQGKSTSARTIGIRQKQARAMELRAQGWAFDRIAVELGYRDKASAFNAVKAALDMVLREPAEHLVEVEQQRLDRALVEVMRVLDAAYPTVDVLSGDDADQRKYLEHIADQLAVRGELNLKAVDRLVRLSESRRKLLGLDQPSKSELDLGNAPVTVVIGAALAPQAASKPG